MNPHISVCSLDVDNFAIQHRFLAPLDQLLRNVGRHGKKELLENLEEDVNVQIHRFYQLESLEGSPLEVWKLQPVSLSQYLRPQQSSDTGDGMPHDDFNTSNASAMGSIHVMKPSGQDTGGGIVESLPSMSGVDSLPLPSSETTRTAPQDKKSRVRKLKKKAQASLRRLSTGSLSTSASIPQPKSTLKKVIEQMPSDARSLFDWIHIPHNHTGWVFVSTSLAPNDYQNPIT